MAVEVLTEAARSRAVGGRLANRAYRELRAGILDGSLATGSVLTEGAPASSLGMSKTRRMALRVLAHEGRLEVGPRHQRVVRGLSAEHRREILEVRDGLERIAVARACASMPVEALDVLHTLRRRQHRAVRAEDEAGFIELDEPFHPGIAAGAGPQVVPRIRTRLRGFVRVMRLGAVPLPGHLVELLAEHRRLLAAIEARSAADGLRALEAHLRTADYPLAAGDGGAPARGAEVSDGGCGG